MSLSVTSQWSVPLVQVLAGGQLDSLSEVAAVERGIYVLLQTFVQLRRGRLPRPEGAAFGVSV